MTYKRGTIGVRDSAEVQIVDPVTGDGLGFFITLAGPEHPEAKRIERAKMTRQLAAMQRTGQLELPTDPSDIEAERIDEMVARTLGWRGLVDEAGPVEFSPTEARALYTEGPDAVWVREQVTKALGDRARFISRSAAA